MHAIRSSSDIRRRYDYTHNLSRRGWAWEFLRRNQKFQAEAAKHAPLVTHVPCNRNIIVVIPGTDQAGAAKWGLYYFPDPNLDGLVADTFWRINLYPRSVPLVLSAPEAGYVDDIYERTTKTCKNVYVVQCPDGLELMIVVGQARTIQAVCSGVSFVEFPRPQMSIGMGDIPELKDKMTNIDRARAVYEIPNLDEPPEWSPRTLRLRDALISLDCKDAGMSLRETACILYGETEVAAAWAGASRSMKDSVRRLRSKGEALRGGLYTDLLGSSS